MSRKECETSALGVSQSGVIECPVCESQDVRISFSRPLYEFVYRWQGLQRYRCRECRKVFRVPLTLGEDFPKRVRRHRRHRIRRFRSNMPAWQRKTTEAVFFLLLVFVFYAALKNAGFSL